MPYLILFMSTALILTIAMHLRKQFRQTAHIRQRLQHARVNKSVQGMHFLRIDK